VVSLLFLCSAEASRFTVPTCPYWCLYASGFLPEVWIADETTRALRRKATRRSQIVRQRSRLKNIIQSILHARLIPSCPHQDLCGRSCLALRADPAWR